MKRYIYIFFILISLIFISERPALTADYPDEVGSDPMILNSLIDNTEVKTEPKVITIRKGKDDKNNEKTNKKQRLKKKSNKDEENNVRSESNDNAEITLDADYMDYYPEKCEIEAVGNAKVILKKENIKLYANKIVFNHDLNNIKAYDNVRLINDESVTDGDFLNLDLNQDEGWISKPITKNAGIKITANEGYLHSDKIEEYNGVAKILQDHNISFASSSFVGIVNPGGLDLGIKDLTAADDKTQETGIYTIKTKEIYIDSKKEHNIVTLKNADLYFRKYKLGRINKLKIVSDKEKSFIETNIPELGSVSHLGMYIGPGIVLNTPGASSLKLVPLLNYGDDKLGIGGIARFRNATNMTEIAYGSSKDTFLLRGYQELNDNLKLAYSQNAFQDEWFLGYRRPRYSARLEYNNDYLIKDLGLNFSQRFSGGYFVDYNTKHLKDAEGRFRWMTQTTKPIYSYKNKNQDFKLDISAVAQTAFSLYTTGDTMGIVRVGPAVSTKYKRWNQTIVYYQSATAGSTPFWFDVYAYGKSNVVIVENIKINKYLSVGYLASLAMLRDNPDANMFQENRFFISVGPEYARVSLGYDAFRQTTMMMFSMAMGTKDSEIEFEKATVKNPDTIGKKPEKRFDLSKIFPNLNKEKETENQKSST